MFAILINEDGQYGTIAICLTAAGAKKVFSSLACYGSGDNLQIVNVDSGQKFYSLDEFEQNYIKI